MFSRSFFVVFCALSVVIQATPHKSFFHHRPGQHNGSQQLCENKPQATRTVVQTVTVTAKPTQQAGGNNQVRPVVPPAQGIASSASSTKTSSRSGAANTAAVGNGNNDGKGNNNNGGGGKGGNNNNNGGNDDPQKSLTLDSRVIATGFQQNGQEPPVAGQVASLTSQNNFINFCLTVPNLPITNGKQIQTGSCNPSPIGMIPSVDNMPSSKFIFPGNFDTIKAGQSFTIEMNIQNMETGFFVNAQANYFAAPQQLNGNGQIKGHSHIVIEKIDSFKQTKPTNPKVFAYFKGLNAAAQGGKLTATVDKGLEAGFYKLSSINTAANHQPAIVPIAQHGSLDDAVYFAVTADGKPLANQGGANNNNNGGNNGNGNTEKDNSNTGKTGATKDNSNTGKGATSTAKGAPATAAASTSAAPGKAAATPAQNDGKKGADNKQDDKTKQGGNNKQQGGNNKQDDKVKSSSSSAASSAATATAQNNKGGKIRRRMINRL